MVATWYKCSLCTQVFSNKSGRRNHVQKYHGDVMVSLDKSQDASPAGGLASPPKSIRNAVDQVVPLGSSSVAVRSVGVGTNGEVRRASIRGFHGIKGRMVQTVLKRKRPNEALPFTFGCNSCTRVFRSRLEFNTHATQHGGIQKRSRSRSQVKVAKVAITKIKIKKLLLVLDKLSETKMELLTHIKAEQSNTSSSSRKTVAGVPAKAIKASNRNASTFGNRRNASGSSGKGNSLAFVNVKPHDMSALKRGSNAAIQDDKYAVHPKLFDAKADQTVEKLESVPGKSSGRRKDGPGHGKIRSNDGKFRTLEKEGHAHGKARLNDGKVRTLGKVEHKSTKPIKRALKSAIPMEMSKPKRLRPRNGGVYYGL